jgi:hypothetical protein
MRRLPVAVLSAVAGIAIATPTSSALARKRAVAPPVSGIQDRYCLQGYELGYPGTCQFSTYEQCMATASGTENGCGINPRYLFPEQGRGYGLPR